MAEFNAIGNFFRNLDACTMEYAKPHLPKLVKLIIRGQYNNDRIGQLIQLKLIETKIGLKYFGNNIRIFPLNSIQCENIMNKCIWNIPKDCRSAVVYFDELVEFAKKCISLKCFSMSWNEEADIPFELIDSMPTLQRLQLCCLPFIFIKAVLNKAVNEILRWP